MTPYLYTLEKPFTHSHRHFNDLTYSNDWVSFEDGILTISPSYSWDGCTPKWQPLGLFTLGTPDGALRYGKPWVHDPSLVHDALCQFRQQLHFSQQQVTEIFDEHLIAVKWPLRKTYTFAVDKFGPQDFPVNGTIQTANNDSNHNQPINGDSMAISTENYIKVSAILVSIAAALISGLQVFSAFENNKLVEAQTVESFIPHLMDEKKKEIALFAMNHYVDREVVNSMALLLKSENTLGKLADSGDKDERKSSSNALDVLKEERQSLIHNMFALDKPKRISSTTSLIRDWDHNIELLQEVLSIAKTKNNKSGVINTLVLFENFDALLLSKYKDELEEYFNLVSGNGDQTRAHIKKLEKMISKVN